MPQGLYFLLLQQLSLVHTQYHQLKVRLAGPDAMRPDRSLDILHEKFPASVTEYVLMAIVFLWDVAFVLIHE